MNKIIFTHTLFYVIFVVDSDQMSIEMNELTEHRSDSTLPIWKVVSLDLPISL